MEFFADIPTSGPERVHSQRGSNGADAASLQQLITLPRLPELCASIDRLLSQQGPDLGEIYCLWGQFMVSRQAIRHGVRLALLNCPHALAWTVAAHPAEQRVVIHCTIDDREESPEFIDSIEQFVADWRHGLAPHMSARQR